MKNIKEKFISAILKIDFTKLNVYELEKVAIIANTIKELDSCPSDTFEKLIKEFENVGKNKEPRDISYYSES